MECEKIKSLLSEYLDRTLPSDLNREVKEHLLSCKKCSNDFFLIKTIAGELAGLERVKAPNYLLDRVNQVITSPSWFSKILDFIPGSGGFKAPMEFVTLATTVALVFLIISNIQTDQDNDVMTAKSGRPETNINNESKGPVRLNYIPLAAEKSHPSSENLVVVAEGHSSNNYDYDKLLSDFEKMVLFSGGDLVKREYARDSGVIEAITVKIPVKNYSSFIRLAEKRGKFNPPAPTLTNKSTDPVILRIGLNLSE